MVENNSSFSNAFPVPVATHSSGLSAIVTGKPVSFEIFSDDLDEMYDQANEIASWGKSIFVKIPITNSKGEKTSGLIKKLLENNIKCNVTAILTIQQVKEIYEISNSETSVIISIFAGRIADTGIDPIPMMSEAINICKNKKNNTGTIVIEYKDLDQLNKIIDIIKTND